MKDKRPVFHHLDVLFKWISIPAVFDRIDESVTELLTGAKQVRINKIHHAPVLQKAILEWSSGQNDTSLGTDAAQGIIQRGFVIFENMTLIANNQVWPRVK